MAGKITALSCALAISAMQFALLASPEYPSVASFNPTWDSAAPGTSRAGRSLPTAALLGNGSLGVVNGGSKDCKTFALTRGDFFSSGDWTDGYGDTNILALSFAELSIIPSPASVRSRDTLDLPTATLVTEGPFGKGNIRIESCVAALEDVFVISGVSSRDDEWQLKLDLPGERKIFPCEAHAGEDVLWVKRSTVNLLPPDDTRGWTTNHIAALTVLGAELCNAARASNAQVGARVKIKANEPFAFIVAANANRRFTWNELQAMRSAHETWWKTWWGRSRIAIGDRELERFYYGQVYLLGATARPGLVPPGLYGIWVTTDNPGWHNDYHMNYNYVATFYGAFAANRQDAARNLPDPLVDYLAAAIENAKTRLQSIDRSKHRFFRNTRAYLDKRKDLADGIDDAALYPVSLGPRGSAPEGPDSIWSQISNGAFVCAVMCTHWEYTLDRNYLKKAWPVLDKTANFLMKWAEREDLPSGGYRYSIWDGHWENSGLEKNSAQAVGCARHLFGTLVSTTGILREMGIDIPHEKAAAWQDFAEHLAPLPVGRAKLNGRDVKVLADVERSDGTARITERGAVFLESIIPGEEFSFDATGAMREYATNAVNVAVSIANGKVWDSPNQTPKLYATAIRTGYPPEPVIEAFKKYQLPRMQKNFTIRDGYHGVEKIGAMEFLLSMLVQSDHGFVKIFPNWTGHDAAFENLRAKGCFLVSAEMENGKVAYASITSERGGMFRLVMPQGLREVPEGWKRGETRNSKEPTIERNFAIGETVRLDFDGASTTKNATP